LGVDFESPTKEELAGAGQVIINGETKILGYTKGKYRGKAQDRLNLESLTGV
jgi:hypothetical protein